MSAAALPVGALLAGGSGRRLGGGKATVELSGRPLLAYALDVLHEVLDEVAVVSKRDTVLPPLAGIANVWIEPDEPRHPLAGIVHALRQAQGRPVLVCAADMPLVTVEVVRALAEADPGGAPAVVPHAAGRLQPLLALYTPLALAGLARFEPSIPTREAVRALGARVVEFEDEQAFFNVNAPEDLLQASALLRARAETGP